MRTSSRAATSTRPSDRSHGSTPKSASAAALSLESGMDPRRILVVDDNADAADSLGMLLQVRGDEVRVAYDGLEALELAGKFNPEVVLLDIGMPKISGYDVARRLREMSGDAVFIVAISGWGPEGDRK